MGDTQTPASVSYDEALRAYELASNVRSEREKEMKDPALFRQRVGYGWESDYHLKRLKEYLGAVNLLLALPQEMKSRLEKELELKTSLDERIKEIVIENAC